jgi:hypothetical protein
VKDRFGLSGFLFFLVTKVAIEADIIFGKLTDPTLTASLHTS